MDENTESLREEDLTTERNVGRRSALLCVGGLALALVAPASTASAKVTDRDSGVCADPAQQGRGRRRRGVTDSDDGRCADPAGFGRGTPFRPHRRPGPTPVPPG